MYILIVVLYSVMICTSLLPHTQEGQEENSTARAIVDRFILFSPVSEKIPYIGNWSNGRGETLSVTKTTLKFANDKVLNYKDITKATDNHHFAIQITTKGKINYFTKFLTLDVSKDEMKMTLYNTYDDMFNGKNSQGETTWYRDK